MDPEVGRQIEQAVAALAGSAPEDAVEALRRLADEHPETPELRLVLAGALSQMGDVEAAVAVLDGILAETPGHPAALFMKAGIAAEEGDLAGAIELLQRAEESSPNDAMIIARQAELQSYGGDLDAAWETARRAVQADRKLPIAWYTMAKVAFDRGDLKEAEKSAKQAAKLDPEAFGVQVLLGWAYLATSRWKDAASAFRRATRIDTENPLGHAGLGMALAQMGKADEALAALRQAMELEPDEAPPLVMAGQAYLVLGQWDDSRSALEEAVEVDPDSVAGLALLIQVAFHMGDATRALEAYRRLKPLDPDLAAELGEELGLNRVVQPATRRKRTATAPAPTGAASETVYQLKVTLRGSKPPIWRRILVTGDTKLSKLHRILQEAMGWSDDHLHQFRIGDAEYSDPAFDLEDVRSEKRVSLAALGLSEGDKFLYEYDFGDDWEHVIQVEKVLPRVEGQHYPQATAGKRNGPPEDVGGIWGYQAFLEAIQDPANPEHENQLEWVGGEFDPEYFDLAGLNEDLREIR